MLGKLLKYDLKWINITRRLNLRNPHAAIQGTRIPNY